MDSPHDMSSSRASRVVQPIISAFLTGATKNYWAGLFGVKSIGKSSFPPVFVTCDKVSGKVALSIPNQVIDHNIVVMVLTLVGKFSGPRPNIDSMRIFVSQRWKIKGQVEVSALPRVFFSFAFSCAEDIPTILCGGPWIMGKSSLTLKKWSPNMDLSDSFFETIPISVKLPGLPLEYWHEDTFKGITGVFGELLSIDPMMVARKTMVYARICVGVSRSKDIPLSVELVSKLGMLVQTIEFESLPFVCFLCKKDEEEITKENVVAVNKEEQNVVILDTLQSSKVDSATDLEGIEFDGEMNYTKVVSKKKKSQQNPGVTTRNRGKVDCGPPRSAGKKSNRWKRE
ncbi:uncharacterized protein LOC131857598 [Cryptomeria japonica]|uniref:uncharacterized protein LOC131857598 n=1 Tax=Cryptomeria japonica TaxID=3369 RepID=UPI0027DA3C50|nr:uncharacterized protein LOC131857598 [Cryptomeria japonica]